MATRTSQSTSFWMDRRHFLWVFPVSIIFVVMLVLLLMGRSKQVAVTSIDTSGYGSGHHKRITTNPYDTPEQAAMRVKLFKVIAKAGAESFDSKNPDYDASYRLVEDSHCNLPFNHLYDIVKRNYNFTEPAPRVP